MLTMLDYGSVMEWAIGVMINSERDWFMSKLSKLGFGKIWIGIIFYCYFILMVLLYDALFIPMINSIGSVRLIWKMMVKAIILLYKKEWSWGTWYETSLRFVHIMPYQRLGIKL